MNESQPARISLQIAFCLICALSMPGDDNATAYGQEQPTKPTSPSANSESRTLPSSTVLNMQLPLELQLMGVWEFAATSYGVQSESTKPFVQRGHWAVTHDGTAYMTAYSFDKARLSGRKFQIRLFAQNDKLVVEQIDVEDSYTKRFGICRLIDNGATVELAFNVPLDGSIGKIPASFDPTFEPKGFVSIVLRRLSEQPEGRRTSVGAHTQESQPDGRVFYSGGIAITR